MQSVTNNQKVTYALWVAIFCNTMSFFGYVYEEIVDVPNFFGSSPTNAKVLWTTYHTVTNPIHYHGFVTIVALIALVIIWFYKEGLDSHQIKKLKLATITFVIANILTIIAVTQLNNKLYFGDPINDAQVVITLASSWAILNLIRAITVFICVVSLLQMFNITIENR